MKIRFSHSGRSVVRAVRTVDGPIHAPRRVEDSEIDRRVARIIDKRLQTRDAMLSAVSPGKVLALGTIWTGSLVPEIDSRLDALRPLLTGFTSGRVLGAEPAEASLDMGRRWTGDIVGLIRAGARDSERGEGERVDLTDLARSASRLEDALERRDRDATATAFAQLRRDFDAVREKHAAAARRTADAAFADRGAREAAATRDTIAGMNSANRSFWNQRSYNGNGTSTAVPVAAARPARTRDWAHEMPGGSPFANAKSLKFGTPRSPSVAEINRRNARFWAEHGGDGPKDAA